MQLCVLPMNTGGRGCISRPTPRSKDYAGGFLERRHSIAVTPTFGEGTPCRTPYSFVEEDTLPVRTTPNESLVSPEVRQRRFQNSLDNQDWLLDRLSSRQRYQKEILLDFRMTRPRGMDLAS